MAELLKRRRLQSPSLTWRRTTESGEASSICAVGADVRIHPVVASFVFAFHRFVTTNQRHGDSHRMIL